MAVKTITITVEAYRKLARDKRGGESFSDVINRKMGGPSLLEFAGILSPRSGEKMAEAIRELRVEADRRVKKTSRGMRG